MKIRTKIVILVSIIVLKLQNIIIERIILE